ncbi:hypothetical protein [Paenibacillus validus]|uniref:hypothetical protein n=1 Tax=Paenibacillus validus TaxID=44253 RepID=UPI003D2CED74
MNGKAKNRNNRRSLAHMSTLNVNILHFRKPWVTAWWSAAFPGFGHLLLGNHFKGAILIVWEVLINMQSHINGAMVLSIHGKYKQAALIINPRWVLLYIAVYIYAIWDSYRTTIEQNKVFTLAERENAPIIRFQMNSLAVQYLDLRSPWLAMVWSLLMPGLGQMYLHRIPTGFLLLIAWIVMAINSNFMKCLLLTIESWGRIHSPMDPQWSLFMPSIYGFAAFDAYVYAVENNKLFEKAQRQWLEEEYQTLGFSIKSGAGG